MTKNETVVGGIGVALGNATSVAHGTSRFNLAVQHMLAAARFSRAVGELEAEHRGKEFAEFWGSILHNAVACVLTTVASLEAYANELFSDRTTVFPGYSKELLNHLWETYERRQTGDKFDFALLLMGKTKLNRGVPPFQDVRVLVELRNALIHFKPEWENEAVEHKRLSEKLHRKIEGSPFLSDEPLFPRGWASHSCTTWAVSNAIAFAKNFEELSGLPEKYKCDPAAITP